ncbi:MAG: hypothetical protein R3E42_17335 [Burkholderiaceae bacterium]
MAWLHRSSPSPACAFHAESQSAGDMPSQRDRSHEPMADQSATPELCSTGQAARSATAAFATASEPLASKRGQSSPMRRTCS